MGINYLNGEGGLDMITGYVDTEWNVNLYYS